MEKINILGFINRIKISQTDLAKELGVGDSTISMYVSPENKSNVGWDKIPKLIELGITIEELFGEEASKTLKDKIIADYLAGAGLDRNLNFTEEEAVKIVRLGLNGLIRNGNV